MRPQRLDQRFERAEEAVAPLAPVPVVAAGAADRAGARALALRVGAAAARADVGDTVQRLVPDRQSGGGEPVAHPGRHRVDPVVIGEGGRVAALHRHVGDRRAQPTRDRGAQRGRQRAVRQQPQRTLRQLPRQFGGIGDGDALGVGRQAEAVPEAGARMHQEPRRHTELRQRAAEEGRIHLAAAEVRLQVDLDQFHAFCREGFIAAISTPQRKANNPRRQPDRWPSSRQRSR